MATEMMDTLNRGSRYRIGMVPEPLAMNPERLADALKQEGVEFLILENYTQSLPEGFGVPYMVISEGESVTDATRRLNVECPEYGPERRWAQTLREDFSVKAQTPPPMPTDADEPAQTQTQPRAPEPQAHRRECLRAIRRQPRPSASLCPSHICCGPYWPPFSAVCPPVSWR